MVPLKYLIIFWRTLEIPLINCEINLIETRSVQWFIVAGTVPNQVPTFPITDTKLHVPVVTLSTQGNVKLLKQLNVAFTRRIKWNKYQSEATIKEQDRYLDCLI